jgi:hypothetical protein
VSEVTKQLTPRFLAQPAMIKKRIESLIERDFLERRDGDRQSCNRAIVQSCNHAAHQPTCDTGNRAALRLHHTKRCRHLESAQRTWRTACDRCRPYSISSTVAMRPVMLMWSAVELATAAVL